MCRAIADLPFDDEARSFRHTRHSSSQVSESARPHATRAQVHDSLCFRRRRRRRLLSFEEDGEDVDRSVACPPAPSLPPSFNLSSLFTLSFAIYGRLTDHARARGSAPLRWGVLVLDGRRAAMHT